LGTSIYNSGNILQRVHDEPTETLKVSIVGSGVPSLGSTVRLSDGTGYLSSTVIGPDRALDVALIGVPEIAISHVDDSIRLGDGTSLVTTTTVGPSVGLDVNLISGSVNGTFTQAPNGPTITTYGESLALAASATSTTSSYTVPALKTSYIQKIYISGAQVGTFVVKIGVSTILTIRTSVTKFSEIIDLSTGSAFGVKVTAGNTVSVLSTNEGSVSGDFNVTIQVMEI
jgi:hypothetical protein